MFGEYQCLHFTKNINETFSIAFKIKNICFRFDGPGFGGRGGGRGGRGRGGPDREPLMDRFSRDEFRGHPDDFRGPQDDFRGPQDDFRGPTDDLRGAPDTGRDFK